MLLHNVVRREQIGRFSNAVLSSRHFSDQITGIAVSTDSENIELHTGNYMLVQLILLENLDAARRRLVLNGIKHLGGIDIGAVNVNLPYLVGRMVAMGALSSRMV